MRGERLHDRREVAQVERRGGNRRGGRRSGRQAGGGGCGRSGGQRQRSSAAQFVFDYSEALGRIGAGTTTANYSPLNPATGAPLFTLLAASWSTGILVGSVLRFNTAAASAAVWALRSTMRSTASGTTGAAWRLLGSVDA
ncbi:hypothetical protein [Rubrivivax rivuli]|uniref:Uncharacterized protein n=1 Tax=Rubrivivax rivuli TaxID=1862385 RepID=A0A437RF39_9BURK|nr:hypothetical protein [Rubrivivax rivuli]RVU45332.1 hypothetical protein EOE66_14490 [Rubrivivax rivuli]